MKLYYSTVSPYSQKVLIALEETKTPHEAIHVNLGDANARAEFAKVSRLGKVPFLVDEARDWRVPESSIIIEYLEQHHPGAVQLVPKDPDLSRQARFFDRLWDLYVTEQTLKIFFDGRRPAEKRDPMGVEQAHKRLDSTFALLDEPLGKKKWVLGDTFSIGDVAAAPALLMASRFHPFDEHKNLVAYFGRLSERESVQRVFAKVKEYLAQR
jgi:glutathione S-transferase